MPREDESANLDFLRSIAVLAVLADHIAGTFGVAQRHAAFWALGRWGVLLFFVHTSLVLMMSMERLGLEGKSLYRTFYIRRFFRIYPLSFAIVGAVLLVHIPETSWAKAFNYPDRGTILSNVLLCQNFTGRYSLIGPLWSLPYEVQMYLLLPAIFLFLRKAKGRALAGLWVAAVVLGLLQAWAAGTDQGRWLHVDRLGIAEFVPCFLAGVIAYQLLRRKKDTGQPFWLWVATIGLSGVIYLEWNARVGYVGYPEWVCCLLVGLMVAYCTESRLGGLNFVTHHVAKYSYGLYLGQVPVLWLAFVKLKNFPLWLQWSVFILLIIGVPIGSYYLVERPFIRFGGAAASRFASRGIPRPYQPSGVRSGHTGAGRSAASPLQADASGDSPG